MDEGYVGKIEIWIVSNGRGDLIVEVFEKFVGWRCSNFVSNVMFIK